MGTNFVVIKLLLFASLKEKFGNQNEYEFSIQREWKTSEDLKCELLEKLTNTEYNCKQNRGTSSMIDKENLIVAVNEEFVMENISLADGDKVCLLQPVSGG